MLPLSRMVIIIFAPRPPTFARQRRLAAGRFPLPPAFHRPGTAAVTRLRRFRLARRFRHRIAMRRQNK